MKKPSLQQHKLERAIMARGVKYSFTRPLLNDLKEAEVDSNGNPVLCVVAKVKGLFTETGIHFIVVTTEAAKVQTKPTPTITALFDDVTALQIGDEVCVPPDSDRRYRVTAINDLGNFGMFANISLEVILNGLSV